MVFSGNSINARYTVGAPKMLGVQQELHTCVLTSFSIGRRLVGSGVDPCLPRPSCVAPSRLQSLWASGGPST